MSLKYLCFSFLFSLALIAPSKAATALGIDTKEWVKPSPEIVAQVEAMEKGIAAAAKGETPSPTLQESIDKIRSLADQGNDKDALFAMGILSQQAQGKDAMDQSMEYYKKAADLGQLQAMNNYGFLLLSSGQEIEKTKEGLSFIKKAAEGGLNAARRNMATIYLGGLGGEEKNVDAAEKLFSEAANAGDAQAQFELCKFYLGAGGEAKTDDDKAWEWLNKASDGGNPDALATLGSVLFDGKKFGARQIPADPKAAVEKFSKLADQNVPAGLRTMGELYANGTAGVEKDFTKAFEYFRKAAQGNDATAQLILAGYYDRGVDIDPKDGKIDVAPNDAAALELYRLAARNQVPLAFYNVGTFYEQGRSVDRDLEKAFVGYLQAASGGFAPAMHKTGVFYLNGAGTKRDLVAAAGWFSRAAAAGSAEGILSLGVMAESGLLPVPADSSPGKFAADAYQKIVSAPQVGGNTRFEALLRLGGLHFRGVIAPVDNKANPDFESAYKYFKRALNLAPDNELAKNTLKEAVAKLTPEQMKKLDGEAASEDAAVKAAAKATPADDAKPAAAEAGATAAPASATTTEPAPETKAAPDAPKGEKAADGEKKSSLFRVFGR